MNYLFVLAGLKVDTPQENTLYLDVGNNLTLGIIDHHHLIDGQKSATRLVYENPSFIPNELETIVLHSSPDLDCIASSYLAAYYFINKRFPSFTKELCDFVDKSDFGLELNGIINLSSIFSIIKNNSNNDEEIVQNGYKLIDNFLSLEKYQDESQEILEDMNLFNADLQVSTSKLFHIKNRFTNQIEQTKGLILEQPKSKLFKFWARDFGYDLLIVKWSKKRTVISLKGDSFLTLEEIAKRLNSDEKAKRIEQNIFLDEPDRDGYDMPDPWYDGRGHNYTIIDTPKMGTVLDLEEIVEIINKG